MNKGLSYFNSIGIPTAIMPFPDVRQSHKTFSAMGRGEIRVVYLYYSLVTNHYVYFMKEMRRHIAQGRLRLRLIVFEEADRLLLSAYRPAHQMSTMRSGEGYNVVCLADTPDPAIISGIRQSFQLPESAVFSLAHLPPRNVAIRALGVERRHDKFPALIELLNDWPVRTFVFGKGHRPALALARKLRYEGHDAIALVDDLEPDAQSASLAESDPFKALKHRVIVTQSTGIQHSLMQHIVFLMIPGAKNLDRRIRTAGRNTDSVCTFILSAQEINEFREGLLCGIASLRTCRDVIAAIFPRDARKFRPGSTIPLSARELGIEFDLSVDVLSIDVPDFLAREEKYIEHMPPCIRKFTYQVTAKGQRYFESPENSATTQANTLRSSLLREGRNGIMDLLAVSKELGLDITSVQEKVIEWLKQGFITGRVLARVTVFKLLRDLPDEDEMVRLARLIHSRLSKSFHKMAESRLRVVDAFRSERCFTAGL